MPSFLIAAASGGFLRMHAEARRIASAAGRPRRSSRWFEISINDLMT
jgi:hypothetical protein